MQVKYLETKEELLDSKDSHVEVVLEDDLGEKAKGSSLVLDSGGDLHEVSTSHSLEPMGVEKNVLEYTASGGEEVSAPKERLDTLDKKLYGLTRFMVRMIHSVTSTISVAMN